MSQPTAGNSRKGLLSRDDYLAPLPLPTGQPPRDVLNVIWRKNEVYLDIGDYSIGSAVMVIWPSLLFFLTMLYVSRDRGDFFLSLMLLASIVVGIPILILLYGLTQPVPPPVRFNRQRREVCVPQKDGNYWIVPWEEVTAAASRDAGGQISFVAGHRSGLRIELPQISNSAETLICPENGGRTWESNPPDTRCASHRS